LESTQTGAHSAHKTPGRAPVANRVVVGCAHLVRWLGLYFGRKEAYIRKKNHVKISAQSELRIFGNIRNGFQPGLGTRNRREQRGRSNLGGAPTPPPPWWPWTRGGILLPSRGEAKEEEEEGGGLSPPLSQWRRRAAGVRIVTAIYINNLATIITNSLPLYAAV